MSRALRRRVGRLRSFPRVSGDEPWATKPRPHYPAFSPRERG